MTVQKFRQWIDCSEMILNRCQTQRDAKKYGGGPNLEDGVGEILSIEKSVEQITSIQNLSLKLREGFDSNQVPS